jgi:DNA repair photolyase
VVTRSLLDERGCRDRAEALLARIESPPPEVIAEEQLGAVLQSLGSRQELRRGGLEGRRAAKRLVALARFAGEELFPGYSWRELRSGRRELRERGVLCQTAVEVQSAVGCPFDCAYCPYTHFICANLDVGGFVDRVTRLVEERRSQSLYKLNNRSDVLGLEPELGLAPAMVDRFSRLQGRYLMLYAKGVEVDSLLDLHHQGKTVACFTLSPEPLAELLETGAPPPAARIRAIGKLAAAGYPIRVRLSPIVPLRGWRESYGDLLARLAAAARPEMVTLWTLSMVPLAELARIVPLDRLDETALAAARQTEDEMQRRKGAPFPPSLRALIYRDLSVLVHERLPGAAVALCLETAEVWDALSRLIVPRRGASFLCNCGPRATPPSVGRLARR